ncbi:hypothetical protein AAG906_006107 [Vitis piasezkii]
MAEDQSVITNENFDSSKANNDKYTRTVDATKTPHPRPTTFDQNLMFIETLGTFEMALIAALEQGLMSASFKFLHSFKVLHNPVRGVDPLILLGLIILLHAYTRATGDYSLSHRLECQNGMKLILSVCLVEGFGTFPTLLCADGCCVTDRRMGVSGYPIEIQALFFMALRCAVHLLREEDGKEFSMRIEKRLQALTYHMRSYFWLDFQQLNNIYRYKTEEYSHTAVNKFNVMPNSIPDWVFDFMPMKGGYFVANVSPTRMDFRWFVLGNCVAILSSLATYNQSMAILDLIEDRWEELVGKMPLKLSYPALDIHGWSIETGSDPKNTRWSSQNGDHGQVSFKSIVVAYCSLHQNRTTEIERKAIELAEQRLSKNGWQECYDGKEGCYVGKQSRRLQTWSIAWYLVSKMLLEEPSHTGIIALDEDKKIKPTTITRATTLPTKFRPYP